jgi:hypothetical protein
MPSGVVELHPAALQEKTGDTAELTVGRDKETLTLSKAP